MKLICVKTNESHDLKAPSFSEDTVKTNLRPGDYKVICDCGQEYDLRFFGGELDYEFCNKCCASFDMEIESITFRSAYRGR